MTTTFEIASAADTYQAFAISRVVDPYAVYNSLSRVPAVRAAAATPAAPITRVDTADFSGNSHIVAAALSDSDLQTERIAALRHSIANGTYRISSGALADSIIKSGLNGW